jgi:hypothetical protein
MEHTPGLETSPPGSDTLEVAGGAGERDRAAVAVDLFEVGVSGEHGLVDLWVTGGEVEGERVEQQ